uniref:BED-type domain-containing protein n=1 Tax=Nothobranchius rachovii TaxID=451742 RepID=A0A1A8PZH5_9TELE
MAAKERIPLVEKRGKTTSVVWKYYGFAESDVNQVDIVCKLCYGVVAAPQGNTTNLFNHLRTAHKVTYDETMKEHREKPSTTPASSSQTSIHATLYNATKYPTSSQTQGDNKRGNFFPRQRPVLSQHSEQPRL